MTRFQIQVEVKDGRCWLYLAARERSGDVEGAADVDGYRNEQKVDRSSVLKFGLVLLWSGPTCADTSTVGPQIWFRTKGDKSSRVNAKSTTI